MKFAATFIFSLLLAITAGAQTSRWLNDYSGTVGTFKIGLTLAAKEIGSFERGDNIDCSYFYVSQLKDIKLKCSIDIAGNFAFQEMDEQGKVRAVFKGRFLQNERDMAEGTWTRAGENRSLPFRMNFDKGISAVDWNRYVQIDANDPVKFENQVRAFKTAVVNGDKQKAVTQIGYPIDLTVNGKRTKVKNQAALLLNYDKVFTKDFIAALDKTVPHNMFVKSTGAMLGGGIVWFWGDGKVIAINN